MFPVLKLLIYTLLQQNDFSIVLCIHFIEYIESTVCSLLFSFSGLDSAQLSGLSTTSTEHWGYSGGYKTWHYNLPKETMVDSKHVVSYLIPNQQDFSSIWIVVRIKEEISHKKLSTVSPDSQPTVLRCWVRGKSVRHTLPPYSTSPAPQNSPEGGFSADKRSGPKN